MQHYLGGSNEWKAFLSNASQHSVVLQNKNNSVAARDKGKCCPDTTHEELDQLLTHPNYKLPFQKIGVRNYIENRKTHTPCLDAVGTAISKTVY